ncbi:bifunctional methylenetetrahydrofolate dehydrogenase/methenyltetrahydrofolate cyclohydrolase FolD [Wenzhouxiangella sp. XN201]|uniref:bifunctional methylenetetrahydrofolate dehydrogenase/methenyltetrahydrofolate cyclohydrolase FolD n=1 Tax=Wenzhouxiangella sp. XN201 TaxID=2710755 RepID=UPI0013CB5599|nr:bifunctional methylenetetrahydrofolate dehydrogenase/methenyltetrahydrofolate cyclohydrolase FolD [Wenzhouxiangella sp. XN201]NEZ04007.1 bifunctional methylenetetrahydrofolate dehydrogenase/methenyltetrahydrofolate cyclohydrolase FolD [Wenzhouxiangella sp. XN201]
MTNARARILDGRAVADRLIANVADAVDTHVAEGGRAPGLAVILVGDDPASQVYVNNKIRACDRAGIVSTTQRLAHGVGRGELLALIDALNRDDSVDGILVQLPLPGHLDERMVTRRISPEKDVDGFHPVNMGRLAVRDPGLRPCTPRGIMTLLAAHGIDAKGMNSLVVGASNIVGRPLALELLLAGATVTIAHRFTRDLAEHVRRAELLCVAVGKPGLIDPGWVAEGAVVVDIGITRGSDGKLHGDVDFDAVSGRADWITPVPGGVGPMTVATLLQNTAEAAGLVVRAP